MKLAKTVLAVAVMAAAVPAMAYQAGDFMVKAGAINVNPKSDNGSLAGSKLSVADNTQLGLNFTYMLAPQVGIEVLAATPFKHDVKLGGATVASTKHLPPTVSAQYYPLDGSSAWQPYVGLGVNYTTFFEEKGAANSLSDSWGWALSAGLNYHVDSNWLLNAAVWKMDIDTKLNGNAADVNIDPVVFFIGGGYKF